MSGPLMHCHSYTCSALLRLRFRDNKMVRLRTIYFFSTKLAMFMLFTNVNEIHTFSMLHYNVELFHFHFCIIGTNK
jgi:hypothetical protein